MPGGNLIVYHTADGRTLLVFQTRTAHPPSVELSAADTAWLIHALTSQPA